jgi:hypothetical protein
MSESEFSKWSGVLWKFNISRHYAYCPTHKYRLDVINRSGFAYDQQTAVIMPDHLLCAVDNEQFAINGGDMVTMRRRFNAVKESESLKNATYRDLDNVYTPILRVDPKPKDKRYSIQVEIDDTPQGKKMVIYAADRNQINDKTQIFIDPEADKLSFDPSDIHPNMIFSKVIAYFKDEKVAELTKEESKES